MKNKTGPAGEVFGVLEGSRRAPSTGKLAKKEVGAPSDCLLLGPSLLRNT